MNKLFYSILSLLLFSVFAYAGDHSATIQSGGITRSFEFYLPNSGMTSQLPLLIVFHGTGGSGANMRNVTGFNAIAENEKFVVVYPNSTTIGNDKQWNVYVDGVPGHGGVSAPNAADDVQFTSDLIDYFCAQYGIDKNKVYATGLSNGGFMTYHLAVALPNRIAAFAPVAANMWGDNNFITNYFTNSYTKVPILHIHGDADNVVSYPDADHNGATWDYPVASFSSANCGISTYTNTAISGTVEKHTYCTAASGFEVSLIRFLGVGHVYPTNVSYNTSQEIWNFMKNYSLNIPGNNCIYLQSNQESDLNSAIHIYPNPASSGQTLSIKGLTPNSEIELLDVQGKQILKSTVNAEEFQWTLPHISSGIYFIKSEQKVQKIIIHK